MNGNVKTEAGVEPVTAVPKPKLKSAPAEAVPIPPKRTAHHQQPPPPEKLKLAPAPSALASPAATNGLSEMNGKLTVHKPPEIPKSLGSDDEAVAWVNDGLQKAFGDGEISRELVKLWLHGLTQYTRSSGHEVSRGEILYN